MALLTAKEQIVEWTRIGSNSVMYPYEELFGRFLGDEVLNHAGNVASPDFPTTFRAGQVWIIDHYGVQNGGVGDKQIGGSLAYDSNLMFYGGQEVKAGGTLELLKVAAAIDKVVNSQLLLGGAAADIVSIHARRIL